MNKKIKSFNLRVYALIIEQEYILVSRELIMGKYLYKFPCQANKYFRFFKHSNNGYYD